MWMMESKTFAVPNIGCDGCVRTIQNEISQLAGVTTVSADRDSKVVTVQWNAPASWQTIEEKLVEIDYAPAQA
jgi:copper chaperone CopZ